MSKDNKQIYQNLSTSRPGNKLVSPKDSKFDSIRKLEDAIGKNDKGFDVFKKTFFISWGVGGLIFAESAGIVGAILGFAPAFLIALIVSLCVSNTQESKKRKTFENHHLFNEYMDAKNNVFKILRSRKEYWKTLDGITFERKIAILFKNMGYRNVNLTPPSNDHGIDITIEDENGICIGIQCKRYSKPVGVGEIRDFYGALVQSKITKGIFVCTGGYTSGATSFCRDVGIKMLQIDDIIKMDAEAMPDYDKNCVEEFLAGMKNARILESYLKSHSQGK